MKKNNINQKKARILLYDIETAYTVGVVWGLYEQNVAHVLKEPYILTVSWKWLDEKTTHVVSLPDFKLYKKDPTNDYEVVKKLHSLFEEADIIIAHNGNGFDQKWSYSRFLVHGMKPPSQAKYVDTLLIARSKFKFNSNKLNDLSKYLGIGSKVDTGGIKLWVDCIEHKNPKAWAKMCKYNKQDVVLLEKVYLKLRPFITNHPNLNMFNNTTHACTNCNSNNMHKRGFYLTRTTKTQRYQCRDCGAWASGENLLR